MEPITPFPVKPYSPSSETIEPHPNDLAGTLTYRELDVMGRALGKNIQSIDELIKAVYAASTFTVEGVPVTLDPRLLIRLKSRCLDKSNWAKWLSEVVIKQLHDYAGY